jgi:hypothetical protein
MDVVHLVIVSKMYIYHIIDEDIKYKAVSLCRQKPSLIAPIDNWLYVRDYVHILNIRNTKSNEINVCLECKNDPRLL